MRSSKRERREAHCAAMKVRRASQFAATAGFTPVANGRINAACQTQFALLMVENPRRNQVEAQEIAVNRVASMLPAPRRVFDWRAKGPSKNDDPAYRGEQFGKVRIANRRVPA